MDQRYYTVKIEADEERGFDVVVPALPGCLTWGATYEDALLHAREAIEGYIETLTKLGKPIPLESNTVQGGFLVLRVTPHIAA